MAVVAVKRETPARVAPIAVSLAAGAALLLLRPTVATSAHRAWILALVYASVLAMSVAPRVEHEHERENPRLHPALVLAAGVAAILLVRLNADRVVVPSRYVVGILLGIAAAIAEEAYFRRLAYGAVIRFGAVAAVVATAVAFAAIHYPGYGAAAMPVDFGAGLVLGWQRWASGTWLIPAVTHALANLLAAT